MDISIWDNEEDRPVSALGGPSDRTSSQDYPWNLESSPVDSMESATNEPDAAGYTLILLDSSDKLAEEK
jgi:hypothetical protein